MEITESDRVSSAQMGREFLAKQPDTIYCQPLKCWLRLSKCLERQKTHYRYTQYYDGKYYLTRFSHMFISCRDCPHFLPDSEVPLIPEPELGDLAIIFGEAA